MKKTKLKKSNEKLLSDKVVLPIQFSREQYELLRRSAYEAKLKMAEIVRKSINSYLGF